MTEQEPESGQGAESSEKSSADEEKSPQSETLGSDGKKTAQEDQGSVLPEGTPAVLTVTAAVLLCTAAILLLFARRGIRLRRRSRQNVREIFRDLFEVLVFAGMPEELDCMGDDFTEKVCEQFLWMNREELEHVMDIVMRANFSDTEPQKEETMQVRGLYRYVCRMVMKGMSGQKRFLFRFIKVYA